MRLNKNVIPHFFFREFKHFLCLQGAFLLFLRNFYAKDKSHHTTHYADIVDMFYRSPSGVISNAFIWSFTPQGQRYWQDLNEQWKQIYRSNMDSTTHTS